MTDILTSPTLEAALTALRPLSRNDEMLTVADARFDIAGALHICGGESCKSLAKVTQVWQWLEEKEATRRSLLAIVGGGSLTDMAGFAGACFKRGMDTAYVPTTLLAAVDAAIGGKTAVNFNGLKNEIGAFHMPRAVVMVPQLWLTLPAREIASGYGELLKTALLDSEAFAMQAIGVGDDIAAGDGKYMIPGELVGRCAEFKQSIVIQDPRDEGIRRSLNLGHTFAHALESYARRRHLPLTHGHAVAIGLLCMSVLSHLKAGLSGIWTEKIAGIVNSLYEPFVWNCNDTDELLHYMHHDKKNHHAGHISFVLLKTPGNPILDFNADDADIRAILDITRDYLHI